MLIMRDYNLNNLNVLPIGSFMNKPIISSFILTLSCFLISGCLNTSNDQQANATHAELSSGSADSQDLSVSGVVTLQDRTLSSLTINGVAQLKNVSLATLTGKGAVGLTNVTITESIDLNGPLESTASTIKTININMIDMWLKNSTVQTIHVRASKKGREQMIILDNSKVENITFEQGKGIVRLLHNAAVTGSVTGGIIVKIS